MPNIDPERKRNPPPEDFRKVFKHKDELLLMSTVNSVVLRFYEPFDHLDHVEHWVGNDVRATRILFDPDLVEELEDIGFRTYTLSNPMNVQVLQTYYDERQQLVDALGEETRGVEIPEGLGDIDAEWRSFKIK